MTNTQNCWDFQGCGREPGGASVHQLGVCPAAIDVSLDGTNHGTNGGRVCWSVAGTLCGGHVQGTFATKYLSCKQCAFFRHVVAAEGVADFTLVPSSGRARALTSLPTANGFTGWAFSIVHDAAGTVAQAQRWANALAAFVDAHPTHPVAILHDASALQTAGTDYRDTFAALERRLAYRLGPVAAVFPNVLMRVLARSIHGASGRNWRFFRTVAEARDYLGEAGFVDAQYPDVPPPRVN